MKLYGLYVIPCCALFACSGASEVAGLERDAGVDTARDAGEGVRDGGAPVDAGLTDAGGEAGGDAGTARDGGAIRDAGEGRDGGGSFLSDWFANYNEGQGTDYLSAPYTTNVGGDPRYPNVAHTHYEDVPYGPFPRNALDFWQADTSTPAPVIVFIHGGGFQGGSRDQVHANGILVPSLLSQGISFAAISYRWAYRDPDAALMAPIPNDIGTEHDVNGTRLDYILRDCARAIQYIRYRAAEWNVDPDRIAAYGGSAGAGCATWTAAVEDLAVPDHADPVLRESTSLWAFGHTNGQVSYDFLRWAPLLMMDEAFVRDQVGTEIVRLTQTSIADMENTPEGQALRRVLDYYEWLDGDDPPFITQNQNADLDEAMITDRSQVIHHPRGHVALYRRCQDEGGTCEINTRIERSAYRGNVIQYLVQQLTR
ncbi:MAG: hypothetical protein RMA76_42055 [Deltaproteobacteria bacterium]|jgi:hypothetical protein